MGWATFSRINFNPRGEVLTRGMSKTAKFHRGILADSLGPSIKQLQRPKWLLLLPFAGFLPLRSALLTGSQLPNVSFLPKAHPGLTQPQRLEAERK